MSFQEYADNMIIRRLEFLSESFSRIDLVFDVYLDTSLKNTARSHRGSGSRRRVLPHLPVPKEWNSFLRNSDNKTELFAFLATHIYQNFHPAGKFVFVTNDSDVLCWPKDQDVSLMAPCNHEEADSRIFVHAYDASSRQDMNGIPVHTVDTDVVVLAITFCGKHPDMELKVAVGSSMRSRYYNARVIQSIIGTDRVLSLLFFYSLTGCDTVSFIHRKTKANAFSLWETMSNITEAFTRVMKNSEQIHENDFSLIESYFVRLYSRTIESYFVRLYSRTSESYFVRLYSRTIESYFVRLYSRTIESYFVRLYNRTSESYFVRLYSRTIESYFVRLYSRTIESYFVRLYSRTIESYFVRLYSRTIESYFVRLYSRTIESYFVRLYSRTIESYFVRLYSRRFFIQRVSKR